MLAVQCHAGDVSSGYATIQAKWLQVSNYIAWQAQPAALKWAARHVRSVLAAAVHVLEAMLSVVGAKGVAHRLETQRAKLLKTCATTGAAVLPSLLRSCATMAGCALAFATACIGARTAVPAVRVQLQHAAAAVAAAAAHTAGDAPEVHATEAAVAQVDAEVMVQIKETINAWLHAKSRAFGSQHDVGALDVVLQGPMLDTWRERAEANQQHWDYATSNVEVRSQSASNWRTSSASLCSQKKA